VHPKTDSWQTFSGPTHATKVVKTNEAWRTTSGGWWAPSKAAKRIAARTWHSGTGHPSKGHMSANIPRQRTLGMEPPKKSRGVSSSAEELLSSPERALIGEGAGGEADCLHPRRTGKSA